MAPPCSVEGGEGHERGALGLHWTVASPPIGQAAHVERSRGSDLLQVRFSQPTVAAATQVEGAHALREGAFDAGARGILRPERGRGLALAGGGEGVVLGAGPERVVAGSHLGAGAARTAGSRRVGARGELGMALGALGALAGGGGAGPHTSA